MADIKLIYEKLKSFEINTTILKPQTIQYLNKIQDAIDEAIRVRKESLENYKKNKLSLNSISNNSNIARQTIYNNPILKIYIEKSIEKENSLDLYETITLLRTQIRDRDEIIDKMVNRDAEISIYKAKNSELQLEILSLKETIKSQEIANATLIQCLNSVK